MRRASLLVSLLLAQGIGCLAQPAFAAEIHALGVGASANTLLRFDSATPATTTALPLSGLTVGDTMVDIDFRPATGVLYDLAVNGNTTRLYSIDIRGGSAIAAAFGPAAINTIVGATSYGMAVAA